jgi:hypothetical protein
MFLLDIGYFMTKRYPNLYYDFCKRKIINHVQEHLKQKNLREKKSMKKRIKPAFCNFHFLGIPNLIFQENLNFYRDGTLLERMSLLVSLTFSLIYFENPHVIRRFLRLGHF